MDFLKISLKTNNTMTQEQFFKEKIFKKVKINQLKDQFPNLIDSINLWCENTPKICHYCSLPQDKLVKLHYLPRHINKRYPKRGKFLEIERKKSDEPYTNIENLVLACYWCNNAKTDTFTEDEFLEVGKVFKKIWEQRLNIKFINYDRNKTCSFR